MKNKGITLVALVITIIILLILAGITISQLTGSGLFENAKLAEQKSKEAQEKEETEIAKLNNDIDNFINSDRSTLSVADIEKIIDEKITERLTSQALLDYDNIVDLSSYSSESNSYITSKNGIIRLRGHKGYIFLYINGSSIACIQPSYDLNASYTTLVNVGDVVYYTTGDGWTNDRIEFIPFK